jgi:hypothetical protein
MNTAHGREHHEHTDTRHQGVREDAPSVPTPEGQDIDEIARLIRNETDALAGLLTREQLVVLEQLLRLYHSLHGPQRLLEVGGNFNRPQFPVTYPRPRA